MLKCDRSPTFIFFPCWSIRKELNWHSHVFYHFVAREHFVCSTAVCCVVTQGWKSVAWRHEEHGCEHWNTSWTPLLSAFGECDRTTSPEETSLLPSCSWTCFSIRRPQLYVCNYRQWLLITQTLPKSKLALTRTKIDFPWISFTRLLEF